jgi:hypothetical protein
MTDTPGVITYTTTPLHPVKTPEAPQTLSAEFASALVAALGELASVDRSKTANAGQYAYKYVDLASVLAAVRPILASYGLAVVQDVATEPGEKAVVVSVQTVIVHCSGGMYRSPMFRLSAPNDAQKIGSATTYGRRYSLMATLNVVGGDDDDDGQAARHPPPRPTSVEPRTKAERAIRETMRELDPQYRVAIQQAFKREFDATLAELAPDRHDEALSWVTERISADLAHELAEAPQLLDPHAPDDPYE